MSSGKTRGHSSSERKALYHAFYASLGLAVFGIYKDSDLTGLAALIVSVCAPMMWYAGARSYVKGKQGE